MQTINIKLENRSAIITNKETIYLTDEEVKFKIVNSDISAIDKLFYSIEQGKSIRIENKEFVVKVCDLKDNIKFTLKSEDMGFPDFFILDLKAKEIKIIGDLLDGKYPDVIQHLSQEIKDLKKVNILLNDRIEKIETKGVI